MSGGKACECSERREPITGRLWRVTQRECNHSAFNGYHHTPSTHSSLRCLRCGASWRTKADYVMSLPDAEPGDINIGPGIAGYEAKMKEFGRESPHG